jgi:glycosyltransferase involved in cell wall biosynthesis
MITGVDIKDKIKVVWICHFSNREIRERLPMAKLRLKNSLKALLGKKSKRDYSDFAPWVSNLIKEFEKFEDVELHVISPFAGMARGTCEFEKNGVFYHFFKPELPLLNFNVPHWLCWRGRSKYLLSRYFVKKFMRRIKPDIVNLIGTENPYYSITTLDIKNIPVYVSAQTVYTNPGRAKHGDNCVSEVWNLELKIHKKEKYYGCAGRMHRDLILNNNPDAIILKMFFPLEKPKQVKPVPKIYDFVFFAGILKKKGIEDLIAALAIVKKYKPEVKLNIIGTCSECYMKFLTDKIKVLDLVENIIFSGYFPVIADMHQHAVQSRFAVFPVKLDIIPSSVIEAILLGLPVVTYKTTGTPYLNRDADAVLLVDIDDTEMLAEKMIMLLESPELADKLRNNARAFVEREFDNTVSAKRLVSDYRAVIEHYYNEKSIPEELLFDINEFPKY